MFFEREKGEEIMALLKWAFILFIMSLVAAVVGFTTLAAVDIAAAARVVFFFFLAICSTLFLVGMYFDRTLSGPKW